MRRAALCLLPTLLSLAFSAPLSLASPDDLVARRKALSDLMHERWEYTMRTNPLYASILGDKRYNDQLDDFSQKHIDEDLQASRDFLARFQAIDTTGFPQQEVLDKELMVRDLKMALEGARFKPWEMPVDQQNGVHRIAGTGEYPRLR